MTMHNLPMMYSYIRFDTQYAVWISCRANVAPKSNLIQLGSAHEWSGVWTGPRATEKLSPDFLSGWFLKNPALRGGPRIFPMRRSSTKKYLQIHLLLFQNTTYFRKPQFFSGGGGVRTPCTSPLHFPLTLEEEKITYLKLVGGVSGNW